MSVWAILRVKDEQDIIKSTVGQLLTQVDRVLVADNGSTDGTVEILEGLPVELIHDPEIGYYQSRAMSALAARAAASGATWVVPADADEWWLAREAPTIKAALEALPSKALIAEAMVLDHVATPGDGMSSWRREAALPLRKVAVRALDGVMIHQGNHGATFPGIRTPLTATGQLEVRHFAVRTSKQLIRKARNGGAAYAATDLPYEVGQHWRDWSKLSDAQLQEVFETYYFSVDPAGDGLVYDPVLTA